AAPQCVELLAGRAQVVESVEAQRGPAVDDETGVAPPPAAVRLQPGEDALADLVQASGVGRCRHGDIVAPRPAHVDAGGAAVGAATRSPLPRGPASRRGPCSHYDPWPEPCEGSPRMTVSAYILIQTEVGKAAQVAEQVRGIEGVVEADDVTGPYDVVAKAESETVDDLGKMVVSRVQMIEGITRTL